VPEEPLGHRGRGHPVPDSGGDVRLEDIGPETGDAFFRCLHLEEPADPVMMSVRTEWASRMTVRGLRAKVLLLDSGEVAGLCQYLPIEHSNYIGEGLMAIMCMWVHGYDHGIGNVQLRGMGRYMLERIESDACCSGMLGVAVWAKDFPYWNPVSFYEHMGYERADQNGFDVLVWKKFSPDAVSPRLLRRRREPAVFPGKVSVTVFDNGWCGGETFYHRVMVDRALTGLEHIAVLTRVDTSDRKVMLDWGIASGLYLDGEAYRPDGPPFTVGELRDEVTSRFAGKERA
jgi:hypothetical protein